MLHCRVLLHFLIYRIKSFSLGWSYIISHRMSVFVFLSMI
nr:MAG TPA: hypothetical protein [Bacteriophage sp.]